MHYALNRALKEWAIAVQALTDGNTIMLLRKGGIREEKGTFEVPHRWVWLYPTYEHQKSEWLKPEYAEQVRPVESGWHPETVPIQSWAEITHVFQVTDPSKVEALYPFHIWTETFADERLKWKPRSPLYILLLRAYRLPQTLAIPFEESYRGCSSWIELDAEAIALLDSEKAHPVMAENNYIRLTEKIKTALGQ